MDRDEAFKLLKGGPQGIKEWNRRLLPDERFPDLGDSDLSGANLNRANFSGANLMREK
jgi:uncharacterized protein YjbI with pentapeptide repeats